MSGRIVKSISIASMLSLMVFVSCSKDDNNTTNDPIVTDPIQTQVENNVQSGTWKIVLFKDSGSDETNHFTGYNFTFGSTGILTASNGTNTYTGSWSISDSNSSDDSQDDLDFNINFNLTNDFEDLNDDWDFISQTSTKMELIDISGGNGGTDNLIFEKN